MSNTICWTQEQQEVIESKKERRLTVDAGPGTGKTAVLCARIAHLIENQAVVPSSIWVISFTRTAVAELRTRISTYLTDSSKSYGIKIATIDSHAWSVNSGFQLETLSLKTFDRGILDVIDLVKTNEGLLEYLSKLEHLFIDESQDVVGSRVELILEIINAINSSAGITILSDEAQAIYGFAEHKEMKKNSTIEGTLPENIKKFYPNFDHLELSEIHRTQDDILKELFTKGRVIVRRKKNLGDNLLKIRKLIRIKNHGRAPSFKDLLDRRKGLGDSSFFLFRSRAQALSAANLLKNSDYRLRMNGMPIVINSWIAKIFWDWKKSEIDRSDFEKLWTDRIKNKPIQELEKSWSLLVQHFGKTDLRVDVRFMNKRLSSISPPADFCEPEFGHAGPLIGTIHTSKGREADDVYLYFGDNDIPHYARKNSNLEEEARVLFVGASRAKKHLYVGESPSEIGKSIKGSSRAYQEHGLKLTHVHVEIGRKEDIVPAGLAGKDFFESSDDVIQSQKIILSLENGLHRADCMIESRGSSEEISVYIDNNKDAPLFYLSDAVKKDFKKLLYELHLRKRGSELWHMKILGCRTMAVSEEHRHHLHSPWSESGFILAPMLTGFPLLAVAF